MVGIWSVAIWSLVRVFGAATESRQLSFAGPRPSGKVRSFAPQTDMVATTGKFAALPWCCRSVTPSGGSTRVSLVFHFQKIMAFGKRAALWQPAGMPDKNSKKMACESS